MTSVTLDALDLAALLCSRVCHDVISPVGAIVNGLEVLEDEDDASMKRVCLRPGSRKARARHQLACSFRALPLALPDQQGQKLIWEMLSRLQRALFTTTSFLLIGKLNAAFCRKIRSSCLILF